MTQRSYQKCDVCGTETVTLLLPLDIVKGKKTHVCLSCQLDIVSSVRENFFEKKRSDRVTIYVSGRPEICFVEDEKSAARLAIYSFEVKNLETANKVVENLNTFYVVFQNGKFLFEI